MPDKDRLLQIELIDKFSEIIGVSVHIVPVPSLVRAPVAPSVDSDTAIAVRCHKKHLVLKGVRSKRPPMIEDDRLPGAPIFVIHVHAVFHCDRTHGKSPFESTVVRMTSAKSADRRIAVREMRGVGANAAVCLFILLERRTSTYWRSSFTSARNVIGSKIEKTIMSYRDRLVNEYIGPVTFS